MTGLYDSMEGLLLGAEPSEEEQQRALIAALRRQELAQQQERAGLQATLGRQQEQAGNLRTLSLLSSMGANPLLQGIQRASGEQGAQLEGLAGRTEHQLAGQRMDPLRALALRLQARRLQLDASKEAGVANRFDRSFGQRGEQFAKRLGLDYAKLTQDQKQFLDALEEKEKDRQAKKEEQVAGATERLGEKLDDTGAPGFYQRYDEAQEILKKYKGDIPGLGRIDGRKPDEMLSPDGRQLRFLVGQMLAEFRKGVTGAGMSDSERVEYGQITGLLNSGNDGAIRQGMDTLRRALDARVKARAASFRPEAVEAYGERNPRVGQVVKRTPAAEALPNDATGNPTLEAPAQQPRIVSVKGLKPGELVNSLQEGEVVRVPMGGGKYQVVRKKGDKLVKVKE